MLIGKQTDIQDYFKMDPMSRPKCTFKFYIHVYELHFDIMKHF